MKILLKRYSFYDSKYRTGDELKDIKKKLKNFKKENKYIIHIWTDISSDDWYIDNLANLYYEELTNFDSKDNSLIEKKISEIQDELADKIYELNVHAEFNFVFYVSIIKV